MIRTLDGVLLVPLKANSTFNKVKGSAISVSYSHLDVYKSQSQTRTRNAISFQIHNVQSVFTRMSRNIH